MPLFIYRYNILFAIMITGLSSAAQRSYKPHSVLASGNWYQLSVTDAGVYKIDMPFLATLGITTNISSAAVRLYGNGGAMLPEANHISRIDDLEENAIMVVDGGDGVLNGSDYILFYASGPNQWQYDSASQRFTHQKNIYTDKAYYYITVGGTGKRITTAATPVAAPIPITSFDEHIYHELDSVNLLSSGKLWLGEEYSDAPGHILSQTFNLPITGIVAGQATITSSVVARSVGNGSAFTVTAANGVVQRITVPPVSAVYLDIYGREATETSTFTLAQNQPALTYTFIPGSFNAQGWLNWFEIMYRRRLSFPNNQQLSFRDRGSVGNNSVSFSITNANNTTQVWDITNPLQPVKINTVLSGNTVSFSNEAQTLHEYIAFSNNYLTPQPVGRIANQDIHHTSPVDYIIITHPSFLAQAQRLAQYHQQKNNFKTIVVTTLQIYNEFSGGVPEPSALRDFVKLYYDTYKATWRQSEKYLLLLGAASFDYKNRIDNNTNYVPAYESDNALDPLSTYTSDDFFGFLDDTEDINSGLITSNLDINIGRIPVKSEAEAENYIDKMEAYHSEAAFGPWRNHITFVADDGDNDLHMQDAESITQTAQAVAPVFNQQKIYLDAYKKEGGSAGGQYPQVKEAINNAISSGTLIWNYNGHGSAGRLAEEAILDQTMVNNWNNANKLPLFITATCDFGPYDNPLIQSLGANLLLRPQTGAIALLTTTRPVFAYSNRIINNNYLKTALQQDSSGHYKTVGEALRIAKNETYATSGDAINNRKFTLLGDPALLLAFPQVKVKAIMVNNRDINNQTDTLRAMEYATISGEVTDNANNIVTGFNGVVYITLFDKVQTLTTLGNDAASPPMTFSAQNNILFKGKATAVGGRFSFTFRMPKDINYQYGRGKISLYAQDGTTDGNGFSDNIIIGGISSNMGSDKDGPVIKAYLNDEKFVNGSITNQSPILLLKLSDSSGINTAGTGIGHDITATLDDDTKSYYILNNFFESDTNSYQTGSLRFQLPPLSPGPHSVKIKVWDVANNSSEYILTFTVVNDEAIKISHVLNYPNPFTTHTTFWFEHNQPQTNLKVTVQIFTLSGKLIKTVQQTINNAGYRSNEVEWDGRDDYGSKVARGVYIYRLGVLGANGKKAYKLERLVIL